MSKLNLYKGKGPLQVSVATILMAAKEISGTEVEAALVALAEKNGWKVSVPGDLVNEVKAHLHNKNQNQLAFSANAAALAGSDQC
jgi:hypothetical protein